MWPKMLLKVRQHGPTYNSGKRDGRRLVTFVDFVTDVISMNLVHLIYYRRIKLMEKHANINLIACVKYFTT